MGSDAQLPVGSRAPRRRRVGSLRCRRSPRPDCWPRGVASWGSGRVGGPDPRPPGSLSDRAGGGAGACLEGGRRVFTLDAGEVQQDDPDDPMRTALRQMMGVFPQLERGMVPARLRRSKEAKRAQGGYLGGQVSYGRKPDGGRGAGGRSGRGAAGGAGVSSTCCRPELPVDLRSLGRGGVQYPSRAPMAARRRSPYRLAERLRLTLPERLGPHGISCSQLLLAAS